MNKLIGGSLVLALASLGWAAPQTGTAPSTDNTQTTKQTGKKSGKHTRRHAKKANTTASQPAK